MLLVDPKHVRLLLMQDSPEDRELLAQAGELFDWQADSVQLFGPVRGAMEIDGVKYPITSFRSAVGADASERLEYQAYELVDELLATLPPSLDKDSLLTSYHEVATNWFRLMLANKAVCDKKHAVIILELDYYDAFENAARRLGRKHIDFIDADWKERQKNLLARWRLTLRDGWSWFSPRMQRRTSMLGERLEPIRYRTVSKLIHWGGTARNKTYAVRYRTGSKLIHWGGMLRIIASKSYRFALKLLKRLPISLTLLFIRPCQFASRSIERSTRYWYRSRKILARLFHSASRSVRKAAAISYRGVSRVRRLLMIGTRYGIMAILFPFKLLMVMYNTGIRLINHEPVLPRQTRRNVQRLQLNSLRVLKKTVARLFTMFGPAEPDKVIDFPELAKILASIDDTDLVLMTVSDSGTRVNLNPAMIVLDELRQRNITSLIVTDSPFVVATGIERDVNNVVFSGNDMSELGKERSPLLPKKLQKQYDVVIITALDELLQVYWPYHMRRIRHIRKLLAQIERSKKVRSIFSVNDYLPVAVAVGSWGLKRDLPWVGHFPILVGARPDGYFFPAPEQLPYGGQLRDHLISAGTDPAKIKVVGAHTYDQHCGRDRKKDRLAVEKDFPRVKGSRLVTIGTEAFPDPETELGPILSAVPLIDGVHVILKLHPEDSLGFFEEFAEKYGVRDRIDIVKAYPLGQLLGASDLLMVVISNIAIEAAVIGTPTLMCDFSGKADVINFVKEGLCVGCDDPAAVGKVVQDLLFNEACAINAKQKMLQGIERFNGPNDGKSCERIAQYIAKRSGLDGSVSELGGGVDFKGEYTR